MRKLPGVESGISSLPSTIWLLCHTTTTPAPSGPPPRGRAYHVGRTV